MQINYKFNPNEIVYRKTDLQQDSIITVYAKVLRENNYRLASGQHLVESLLYSEDEYNTYIEEQLTLLENKLRGIS
jgi:hypothetical protein